MEPKHDYQVEYKWLKSTFWMQIPNEKQQNCKLWFKGWFWDCIKLGKFHIYTRIPAEEGNVTDLLCISSGSVHPCTKGLQDRIREVPSGNTSRRESLFALPTDRLYGLALCVPFSTVTDHSPSPSRCLVATFNKLQWI